MTHERSRLLRQRRLRRLTRLLLVLGLAAVLAALAVPRYRAGLRPLLADLRRALAARDAESFLAHCDLAGRAASAPSQAEGWLAQQMRMQAPDLAGLQPEERRRAAVQAGLRAAIEAGRSLGSWAETAWPRVDRRGDRWLVRHRRKDPHEALALRREDDGRWVVCDLPWERLRP